MVDRRQPASMSAMDQDDPSTQPPPDSRIALIEQAVLQMVLRLQGSVTKEGEPFTPQEVASANALLPILLLEADRIARDAGIGPIGVAMRSHWDTLCGIAVDRPPSAPLSLVLLLVLQGLLAEHEDAGGRVRDVPVDRMVDRWMRAIDRVGYESAVAG